MVRFKKRYLVLEVHLPPKFKQNEKSLSLSIRNHVRQLHGEFGVAAVDKGLRVKYVNNETNIAIVSVARYGYQLVASVVPFIKPVTLRTLYAGGSLKHSMLFIKKYHEKALKESKGEVSTAK